MQFYGIWKIPLSSISQRIPIILCSVSFYYNIAERRGEMQEWMDFNLR